MFFNGAGGSSSVQYIGDIKFPEISDTSSSQVGTTYGGQALYHFPISLSRGYDGSGDAGYVDLFSLGINFTVNLDQDFLTANDITHYQIVRCKRKDSDKTRLAQGAVNKWYLPSTNQDHPNTQNDPEVFYPVAEMLDIPGHLNRYYKNGGDDDEGIGMHSGFNSAPDAFGEQKGSFNYGGGGIEGANKEGLHGDMNIISSHVHDVQSGTGYDFHNNVFNPILPSNDRRTGIGYPGGSFLGEGPDDPDDQSPRRNIIETSVPYQSAASVECLMSFHCPEITFNHFVPNLSGGTDFLRTVGLLSYTTKFNRQKDHQPFGLADSGSGGEDSYKFDTHVVKAGKLRNFTQWGHTLYCIQENDQNGQNGVDNDRGTMERGTEDNNVGTARKKRRNYRPALGVDGLLGADGQHELTYHYKKKHPKRSERRIITKARQTSPLDALGNAPADFHLHPSNFEEIKDMQSIVPSTYVHDSVVTVGDFICKNLAFELGNVLVDGVEHTRMARHGTNLLISTGTIAGAAFHCTTDNRDNAGRFIAKHPNFGAMAGPRAKNLAGSAFLVEYVRRNTNQYGGQSETAVAANTFFTTSAPIRITETNATTGEVTVTASQNFKVFEGDTFVQFYEFMKNFWNNQYNKDDETSQNASAFLYDGSSTFETVVMPVESVINIELNAGATRFVPNDGKFHPDDDDFPTNHRMQENLDVNGVSNVLFNGTTKAFDYNPVFSEDQITKIFFADPPNFNPVSEFDVRTYYSNTKILGETIDAFTQFGLLNYRDIDPAYGAINRLLNLQDEIVTVQDDAIGVFLINTRELASAESGALITLGTGAGVQDFSYITTQNGSIHQYAAVVADGVAYVFDAKRKALVILSGTKAEDISKALGMNSFFNDNVGGMMLLTKKQGGDNPLIGIGATLGYDTRNREVLISLFGNKYGYNLNNNYAYGPRQAFKGGISGLALDGNIEILYMNGVPFDVTNLPVQAGGNPGVVNIDADAVNTPGDSLSALGEIRETDITPLIPLPDFNSNLFDVLQNIDGNFESILPATKIDGSTLVYSEVMGKFTSFYSCLPSKYLNGFRELMSVPNFLSGGAKQADKLFVHNEGDYGEFYGEVSDTSLTFIVNTGALLNKILRFIEYNCTVKDENGNVIQSAGLNRIRVENDYQDSSEVEIDQVHRFRKFRIKLPRDEEGGRFRGTFFKVSLFFDNSVNLSLTLQRIMSFFDIQTY